MRFIHISAADKLISRKMWYKCQARFRGLPEPQRHRNSEYEKIVGTFFRVGGSPSDVRHVGSEKT